jgi:hypothetical protein
MKVEKIALVLILAGVLIIPSAALTDNEETLIESKGTTVLNQADSITYGLVEIDSDNSMNIWYIPKNADEDTVIKSTATAVGIYIATAKMYPEMSNLNLMVGTKDNVVAKMYCERAWVDQVRADGPYAQDDIGLVGLKVFGTLKQTA